MSNDNIVDLKEKAKTSLINQHMFIKWMEKCCCDFVEPRNNNEHSLTCLNRFITLVGDYKA
jgi:hypothetical protein